MKLNKEQLEAVKHQGGALFIIAGAGTGKTSVITERIKYLIEKKLANPSEILALTFTEKAASEMEERIDIAMPYGYEEVAVSTFHSFCDKLLKLEGIYIGLDSSYSLMSDSESYMLMRKHLFEFPLDKFRPLGSPTKFIGDILKHFSRLQDEDVSAEEYLKYVKSLPQTNKEEKEEYLEAKELAETYKMYHELKLSESKLDFGDVITLNLKLFRNKLNILKKYHERYKYVLVDEYQDTNYAQNELVNLLVLGKDPKKATKVEKRNANITVVGDDDQSIYKFRGAAISNIIQFKSLYPEAKRVVLNENYRSTQDILDSAYDLISNNNPYRLEITESINKKLKANREEISSSVNVIFSNKSDNEAEQVALEIKKLVTSGSYDYSDIAILTRANSHSDEFTQAMRFHGIPFKYGGYRGLYSRDEIRELVSFLRLVADYSNDISMLNLLSMKIWDLSARDVVEIMKEARSTKTSAFKVIELLVKEQGINENISDKGLLSITKIVELLEQSFAMLKDGRSSGQILFKFFEDSGIKDTLLEDETVENSFKVENIRKYFEMIKDYENNNSKSTLYEYLDYLDYSIEIGENPSVDMDFLADLDAVNVSTVHSAKGLEFPVVFLVNLVSERFPSRNRRDTIPIPVGLIKEILPEEGEQPEHLQEERRLFYVGATRAKDKLYLTASNFYAEAKRKKRPSIFLNEILNRDIGKELSELIEKEEEVKFPVYEKADPNVGMLDLKKLGLKISNEFSYTQIQTYEMCPRQYKYRYLLKLPTPPSATLSFGSTIHAVLRLFYERVKVGKEGLEGFVGMPSKKDLLHLYEQNCSTIGYETKLHEEKRFKYGKKILEELFETLDLEKENPLEFERRFKYGIEDILITGAIDRIDKVDDRTVEIVDYKTGKEKSKTDANKDWQLVLYTMVAEEQLGYKVSKAYYYFVETGKKVEVDISKEKQEWVRKKVIEVVTKIRSGDFKIPSGHQCYFCDYQDVCEGAII